MPWPKGRLQTDAEKTARAATRAGFHRLPQATRTAVAQEGGRESARSPLHHKRAPWTAKDVRGYLARRWNRTATSR